MDTSILLTLGIVAVCAALVVVVWRLFRFVMPRGAVVLIFVAPIAVGVLSTPRHGLDTFYVMALSFLLLSDFTEARIYSARLRRIEDALGLKPAESDPELERLMRATKPE